MTTDDLSLIIERLKAGSRDEADIQAIAAAIATGKLILASAPGAVSIGGDASGSQVVTGHGNVMGDRNIVIYGADAQTIQAILNQHSSTEQSTLNKSVDELVQQVRSRIHDDIQRLHGTMPLWGVDHWVPLGDLFVDVNILEEVSSNRRSELADLWQDFRQNPGYRSLDRMGLGKERQRVSGLAVLDRNTNLMVVGKPGSGKTTYLQRVVTECNAGNLQAHRIPVLIRLREFVEDGRGVDYAVERYLERCWWLSAGEVQSVLEAGRSLVLLDGLDEVTGADGQAIAKQIKRFARNYPHVQVIVTCRTQSQESRFERFDSVEVADFNEPQVRAFAEHWFQTVCGDVTTGQTKAAAFLDQLFREENQPIRELAITPILLSLTCAVFQQKQAFYSKRSKLYEEGLELLLEQWDKSREIERDEVYRNLSVERKWSLLSYLAVKKFEQEQYVLFEQAELEGYIAEFLGIEVRESRGVLRAIEAQHGLLIERSQKVWSFSHLTFQEYFVTQYFTRSINIQNVDILLKYVTSASWYEIFELVGKSPCWNSKNLFLLKERVDKILCKSRKLQYFLHWIAQKSSLVQTSYKLEAVRAFYFSLESTIDFAASTALVVRHSRVVPVLLELSLAFLLDDVLTSLFKEFNEKSVVDLTDQNIKFNIEQYDELKVDIILVSIRTDIFIQNINTKIHNVIDLCSRARRNASSCNLLLDSLQQLEKQLPKPFPVNVGIQEKWWNRHGCKWTKKLDTLMINFRSMGYFWSFNRDEVLLLQQYYSANKFLVTCLSNSYQVERDVALKIQETILLPIAEIERRSREKVESGDIPSSVT